MGFPQTNKSLLTLSPVSSEFPGPFPSGFGEVVRSTATLGLHRVLACAFPFLVFVT